MFWHTITSYFAVSITLVLCGLAWSQDNSSPTFQSQVALDALKKHAELAEQLDEQVKTHWDTVKQQYLAKVAHNKKELIAALSSARDEAAKQVNLKEANALQEAIDQYEDEEVFFPIPLPEMETEKAPQGQWSGNWNGSTERLSLDINKTGTISRRWKLQSVEGRLLAIDPKNELHLELIVKEDRLVVLGWTGVEADHFQKSAPQVWLTEVPNRVTILRQSGVVRIPVSKEINRFPAASPTTNLTHYSVDGDGKRGVLDLVFNSRELDWTKRPKSATLFFHVHDSDDAATDSEVYVYSGDQKIGTGHAREINQWQSITLDPVLLLPSRSHVLQLRVDSNNAVVIRGKASGQTPYLELVLEN